MWGFIEDRVDGGRLGEGLFRGEGRLIIKESKESNSLIFFDFLIYFLEVTHTSYLNEGHCSTDKVFWMLIIMYANDYNSISVLAGLKK